MRFDSLDRQLLTALDPEFTVDGEVATVSGPRTIRIVRTGDDRLELTIEFSDRAFPILLSRTQTLRQLGVKADDNGQT